MDEEYVGKPYHEKKFHKTHFGVQRELKNRVRVEDDPDWVYLGVGRWKYIPKETRKAQ